DVRPWVQFDGSHYLGSSTGISAVGTSLYFVVKPDALISLSATQLADAPFYSFHGLSAKPDTSEEPGNLASLQEYNSGLQHYLLAGPVPEAIYPYPHQYTNPSPVPEQVFDHLSYYRHEKMLSNGKYNGVGLSKQTRPNLPTSL